MAFPSEHEPIPAHDPSSKTVSPPLPDELAQTLAGLEPAGDAPPVPTEEKTRLPFTRAGAFWYGIWAGVAVLILLIIFVAQNTASVRINFLWMDGQISLALALLIAGVGGAVIAMAVAAARILQLRRMVRRR